MIANNNLKIHHIKLFKILKTLSHKEYLHLIKFLKSPFFNYSLPNIHFCEALKQHHPTFDNPKLTPENIWIKVFNDKPFVPQKFRQLCSDLARLVEQFLIQLELAASSEKSQNLLIQSLGKRNEHTLFKKATKERLKAMDKKEILDASWFRERIDLLETQYAHPLYNKLINKDDLLIHLMDSVDAYFLFQKAKIGIGLINQQRQFNTLYDIQFLDVLEKSKKNSILSENILFSLYQISFNLLQKEQNEDFLKLEKLLFPNLSILKKHNGNLFFFNGLNYAVRKINQGNDQFRKDVLRWYKVGLKEKMVFSDGMISVSTFQNIIFIACVEGEFDFCKEFIDTYQEYLPEDLKENTVAYGWGLFWFHQKDFEKTIVILATKKWNQSHKLSGKNLLVRTYFEYFLLNNEYFHLLQDTIWAFDVFLERTQEFPKLSLESHRNLIRILKPLSKKILNSEEQVEIQNWLEQQLKKKKKVISKSWLTDLIKGVGKI
jgi:hypothetical protein